MQRGPLAATALLFAASVAGTIYLCGSMSGGMPMPGGWTMSMAWMRMPGWTWPGAAAMFLAMWIVMMLAMMLPSLAAMLRSYPTDLRGFLAVSSAYFLVWTIAGLAVYPAGLALAAAEMRWPPLARAVPLAGGLVLIAAGIVQLTPWKARQLGVCRNPALHLKSGMPVVEEGWKAERLQGTEAVPGVSFQPSSLSAFGSGSESTSCAKPRIPMACPTPWQHGLHFGRHCALCCSPQMAALLILGVMDLRVMLIIAIAITIERVAPRPVLWARLTGVAIVIVGAALIFWSRQ